MVVENMEQTREKPGLFYYNETIKCQFKVGSDSYQRAIHHND